MQRITEFHNIMPIANIPSVLQHGLLSHQQASLLDHADISLAEVQDLRDKKSVPRGMTLHRYANVYFHARNPMMFLRNNEAENLCVLRISKDILQFQNVVVADQNAASNYVRFLSPQQISPDTLDLDLIYAEDWRHPDQITYWRRKSRKCAEVLVPNRIPIEYVLGVYVVSQQAANQLLQYGCRLPAEICPYLFFR
jgi:hypothetical protein